MDVGEFNGRTLYTGLRLDYKLMLSARTYASFAASAVAELFVLICDSEQMSGSVCFRALNWYGH